MMEQQQTVTDVEQTMQICPLNWQCSDRECTMAHTSPPSYQTIPPQFAVNPYYNNGYHYNFRVPAPSLAPISHPGVASWNHYNRSMYPSKPCKFGFHCHNPSCNYIHPPNYNNFAGAPTADGFESPPAAASHASPNSTESNTTEEVTYSTDDALTNGQQQTDGTNPSANGGHVYSHSSTVLCKYGTACRYPNCRFVHPQGVATGGVPSIPRGHYPFSAYMYTGDRPIPLCRYGTNCLNQNCMFTHPERANQSLQEGAGLDLTSEVEGEVVGEQQNQANEQQDQQPQQTRGGEVWGGAGKNQRQQLSPQHQQSQSAEEDAQSDWPLPSTASNPQAAKKVCRYGTNCRNASSGKCKFVHNAGTDADANDSNGNTNQNGVNSGNNTSTTNNNHNSYHPHHNYNNNKTGYHNRGSFANHNHHHQNNSMPYQNHSNQGNFHNNTNGLINNNSHFNNRGKFFNHNNNGNNTNRNRGGHRTDGSNGIRKSPIGGGAGGGILCRYGARCRNKYSGIGCKFLHAESDGVAAMNATVVGDIEDGVSALDLNGNDHEESIKNVQSSDQTTSASGGEEDGKKHLGEIHHATNHVSENAGAHAVENVAGVSAHQHANGLAQ